MATSEKLPIWRRIRRRAYWVLVVVLLKLSDLLPISVGRHLGVGLARFAVKIRPSERRLAEANIRLAYPELDQQAINCLLSESVDALGSNFFDMLAAHRLIYREKLVKDEVDSYSDGKSITEVLAQLISRGRGVIILSGHVGCWELSGGALGQLWFNRYSTALDLSVITGTVHNPAINRLLQNRRKKLGVGILPREDGLKPLLNKLDNGGVVAVLLDQKTEVQNLPVVFFGHEAPTPSGLARIALKRGIPILPVVMARDGQGHVIRHLPPIYSEEFLGSDGEAGENQQIALLTACNQQLESLIRRNQSEWVWFHDRWGLSITNDSNKEDLLH